MKSLIVFIIILTNLIYLPRRKTNKIIIFDVKTILSSILLVVKKK